MMIVQRPANWLVVFGLLCGSCTKEEFTEPDVMHAVQATQAVPVDYIPVYDSSAAVLVAIANYDYVDVNGVVTEQVTGLARAVFPDANGNYINVGDVRSQDISLNVGGENRYKLDPSASLPTGLNFISTPSYRWSVAGNAHFPSIDFICATGFPVISEMVTSLPEIDRNSDFTFSTTVPVDDADSILFTVFAVNGYLFACKKGIHYSHTFTPAKLQLLASGNGYVRITAFNTVALEIQGKYVKYINQVVTTRAIAIR